MMRSDFPIAPDEDLTSIDPLILSLLAALLVFMPFAFGTIHPWSELIAYSLGSLLAFCLGSRSLIARGRSGIPRVVIVPIIAFVMLALFQLVPLPVSVVRAISPHTARTQIELLRDIPGSETFLKRLSISFYPLATRNTLRIVLLASVIFMAVLITCRSPRRIRMLLIVVALIGGAMATLALAQDLTGATKIFWLIDTDYPTHSGTFLHHSHFGQFMNLSIGAALALLLVRLRGTTTIIVEDDYLGPSSQRFRDNIWWPMAVIIAGMTAIALSLTRGGVVAMGVAAPATMMLLITQKRLRKIAGLMLLLMMLAGIGVGFLAFDKVSRRLSTLGSAEHYSGRLQNVKDVAVIFKKFPLLGSGLGTHETFFPRFMRTFDPMPSGHAENEYAEIAEEMGAAGLVCVMIFVGVVWFCLLRSAIRNDSPTSAAAIGLGYGLLAVMIHSLSDFGQHIPAVAGLSAVTCGLIINATRIDAPAKKIQFAMPRRVMGVGALLCAILISAWAMPDAYTAFRARWHWDKVDRIARSLRHHRWQGDDTYYASLIAGLESAARGEPDDVTYRYWLNVYRYHSMTHAPRLNTEIFDLPAWRMSVIESIVLDAHQARRLCPTFGPLYALAGELETLVLGRAVGEQHIQQAFALGANDFESCFLSGMVDARHGEWESAKMKFRRASALSGDAFAPIASFYVKTMKRGDLAIDFASDNWRTEMRMRDEFNVLGEPALVDAATQKVITMLESICDMPDADANALGTLALFKFIQKKHEDATRLYARAIEIAPNNPDWRVARARSLVALGRLDEATAEAQTVLHDAPNTPLLTNLLAELRDAIALRRKK